MCACTDEGMAMHALNTVHHPVNSRLSNPGLQCTLISQESGRKLINSLRSPTGFVDFRNVTDTIAKLSGGVLN